MLRTLIVAAWIVLSIGAVLGVTTSFLPEMEKGTRSKALIGAGGCLIGGALLCLVFRLYCT